MAHDVANRRENQKVICNCEKRCLPGSYVAAFPYFESWPSQAKLSGPWACFQIQEPRPDAVAM